MILLPHCGRLILLGIPPHRFAPLQHLDDISNLYRLTHGSWRRNGIHGKVDCVWFRRIQLTKVSQCGYWLVGDLTHYLIGATLLAPRARGYQVIDDGSDLYHLHAIFCKGFRPGNHNIGSKARHGERFLTLGLDPSIEFRKRGF
jgi:hypothetical protein